VNLPDAVLTGPLPIWGLSTHQIFEEKPCLAVPPGHSFAALPSIRAEQLAGEPLIATPPDVAPTLRDAILRFFRSGGVTPTIRLEAQLQQTIVSLVAAKLGVALAPDIDEQARIGRCGVLSPGGRADGRSCHCVARRQSEPDVAPILGGGWVAKAAISLLFLHRC
jgi:DNA-binding transcriptional LysR family regulator